MHTVITHRSEMAAQNLVARPAGVDEVDRDRYRSTASDRHFASALWRPGGSAGIEGCRPHCSTGARSALAARLLPSPR